MLKLNSKESNIWFTSDTHGYHKNITRGVSEWDHGRGTRDFDTIEEMTNAVINGINKYVGTDDILFHLGDWTFGGIDKIFTFWDRIICENIHLIGGNHDLHIIENKFIPYSEERFHDLFESVTLSNLIKIDKTLVYMSHFPCEAVRFDKRSIHLHGHVHGKYPLTKGKIDVGMDNAFKLFGEYRPFSWEELKEF